MNIKKEFFLSLFALMANSLVNAQNDKRLLGTWTTKIDYETYTLEFISESQLILNGETYGYTLKDSNIVADYQYYPYSFKGADLFITADGYEYKFTRSGDMIENAPTAALLLGKWENKDEYGTHKVTFHSESQLEYDGEWTGYSIQDNAIVVDYEKFLFKIENGILMVKWPDESNYRKFTRIEE
jgi:hypothetical protein